MLLAAAILVFAPLVIVPLGLSHLHEVATTVPKLWSWVRRLQFPAAISFAIAFFLSQGSIAALLCLPWVAITGLLALCGVIYLAKKVRSVDSKLLIAAALCFIPIGSSWALISRWGFPPTPFSDEIILLTGVHFHYAAFALPIIASSIMQSSPTWHERLMVVGLITGIPLLAIGITFSPLIEVAAALVIACSCWWLAALMFLRADDTNATAAALQNISALSIACGMVLAAMYALGEYTGNSWIDIPMMIPLHGVANSIGFSLLGLLSLYYRRASTAAVADGNT
jgi:uncharacterized membrane protein